MKADALHQPVKPAQHGGFQVPDVFGFRRAGLTGLEGFFLFLVVALAPINYLRLQAVYFTASDACAVIAVIVLVSQQRLPLNYFGRASGMWYLSFFLFAGGLTISSLVNGNPVELVTVVSQYFFSLMLLPLLLGARSYPQVIALLRVLIVSITFVMVFGAYIVHFVEDAGPRLLSYNGRMRSLIERENECATLAAIAIILTLGLYYLKEIKAIWLVICLPALYYGVILTGSNSGLLISTLGTIIIVFLCGTRRSIVITLVGFLIALFSMLEFGQYFLPEVFQDRVLGALVDGDISEAGTFDGRYFLIQEALHVAQDTLFLGLGAEQYRTVSDHGAPVHSMYLLALTEGGLISLLGLVGFILTGIYLAWLAFASNGSRKVPAITLTILMVYSVMLNMFPAFYPRFWNVPLILALSLSASCMAEFRTGLANHQNNTATPRTGRITH